MYFTATAMLGSMVAAVPAAAADEEQTLTVWCWDPNFNIYAMQQAEKNLPGRSS